MTLCDHDKTDSVLVMTLCDHDKTDNYNSVSIGYDNVIMIHESPFVSRL